MTTTAKVQDFMTEKQKKELTKMTAPETGEGKQRGLKDDQTCEPVFLRKLVEASDQTTAGEYLGVSPSHISNMLKQNEARLSFELAAELIFNRHFTPPQQEPENKRFSAVVCAEGKTMSFIRELIERAGGKFVKIEL